MGGKQRVASRGAGGERLATPPCAICGHCGQNERTQHHLTHGVVIWLCRAHTTDEFLQRRAGHEFAKRLAAMWEATGGLTRRRLAALRVYLQQIRDAATAKDLPGSYSWPNLRREAERRFAAGESPDVVITELRRTYRDGPAMVPSVRTMRRWFTQARWRVVVPARGRIPRRGDESRSPYLDLILDHLVTGSLYPLRVILDRLYGGP